MVKLNIQSFQTNSGNILSEWNARKAPHFVALGLHFVAQSNAQQW